MEKKICILAGSPKKGGNTEMLLSPFISEIEKYGCTTEQIRLYEKKLLPCLACRTCQKDWSIFGCPQPDDMQEIFDAVRNCILLVLATPIYSWYCTPPMKAVLDRLVYGMNKYYGEKTGPSLWQDTPVALLVTCGYPPEKGADLWEMGIRRYCKHSKLRYLGMLAEHHRGYQSVFMDEEKAQHARQFAAAIARELSWGDEGGLKDLSRYADDRF